MSLAANLPMQVEVAAVRLKPVPRGLRKEELARDHIVRTVAERPRRRRRGAHRKAKAKKITQEAKKESAQEGEINRVVCQENEEAEQENKEAESAWKRIVKNHNLMMDSLATQGNNDDEGEFGEKGLGLDPDADVDEAATPSTITGGGANTPPTSITLPDEDKDEDAADSSGSSIPDDGSSYQKQFIFFEKKFKNLSLCPVDHTSCLGRYKRPRGCSERINGGTGGDEISNRGDEPSTGGDEPSTPESSKESEKKKLPYNLICRQRSRRYIRRENKKRS